MRSPLFQNYLRLPRKPHTLWRSGRAISKSNRSPMKSRVDGGPRGEATAVSIRGNVAFPRFTIFAYFFLRQSGNAVSVYLFVSRINVDAVSELEGHFAAERKPPLDLRAILLDDFHRAQIV